MISMKKISLSFVISILSLIVSCDVTEPDRYYNTEPEKTTFGILTAQNYDSTKVYINPENILFTIDSTNFRVKQINLFFDDRSPIVINNLFNNSFSFYFNPSNIADGKHELIISVVGKNKGLLSLNNVGVLNYKISIYTSSGNSLATEIDSVVILDKPTIYWKASADPYFKSYKVVRKLNGVSDTLTTILSPEIVSYKDITYPDIYGKKVVSYQLVTESDYHIYVSQFKEIDNLSIFQELPLKESIYFNSFLALNSENLIFYNLPNYGMKNVNITSLVSSGFANCHLQRDLKFNFYRDKVISTTNEYESGLNISDLNNSQLNFNNYVYNNIRFQYLTYEEIFPNVLFLSYLNLNNPSTNSFVFFNIDNLSFFKPTVIENLPAPGELLTITSNRLAYYKKYFNGDDIYIIDLNDTSNISATFLKQIPGFRKMKYIDSNLLYVEKNGELSICNQDLQAQFTLPINDSIINSNSNTSIVVLYTKETNSGFNCVRIFNLSNLTEIKKFYTSFEINNIILYSDNSIVFENYNQNNSSSEYYKLK